MDNNNQSWEQQWDSAQPPRVLKKNKGKQQILFAALLVFGLLALAVTLLSFFRPSNCRQDLGKIAVQSLMLKVDNPESVTVLEVSEADSVWKNRYCSEVEIIDLSQKFLDYSVNLMNTERDNKSAKDDLLVSMSERYSADAQAIDRLNNMLALEKGDFCGYKVRVRFKAMDRYKAPYSTEAWFIFDKSRQHIIDYIELPLI